MDKPSPLKRTCLTPRNIKARAVPIRVSPLQSPHRPPIIVVPKTQRTARGGRPRHRLSQPICPARLQGDNRFS